MTIVCERINTGLAVVRDESPDEFTSGFGDVRTWSADPSRSAATLMTQLGRCGRTFSVMHNAISFSFALALRRWPRSPHTDAFEEEAHGRLDALLHGLSRPRVA